MIRIELSLSKCPTIIDGIEHRETSIHFTTDSVPFSVIDSPFVGELIRRTTVLTGASAGKRVLLFEGAYEDFQQKRGIPELIFYKSKELG
jgi:hypothetical protein